MALRFTIIDYTTNPTGDTTIVNEPVGWDAVGMRLKRDKNWHGFFDFFDDSYNQMQWHGAARTILKNAYEADGVEAHCELKVEYACSDTNAYTRVYLGRFVFARYADVCAGYCYVECGVENSNCLMAFKNRYNQKVDLDSLDYFDKADCDGQIDTILPTGIDFSGSTITVYGFTLSDDTEGRWIKITGSTYNDGQYLVVSVTIVGSNTTIVIDGTLVTESGTESRLQSFCLPRYHSMNKSITLPAKILAYEGVSSYQEAYTIDMEHDFNGDTVEIGLPNFSTAHAATVFNLNLNLDEITDMQSTGVAVWNTSGSAPEAQIPPVLMFTGSNNLQCVNQLLLDVHVSGTLFDDYNADRDVNFFVTLSKGTSWIDSGTDIITEDTYFYHSDIGDTATHVFSFDRTDLPVTLVNGENLYLFVALISNRGFGGLGDPTAIVKIDVDAGAFIRIKSASQCEPTMAKVYLVNETLSRIAEAYTSDCLRVKSDYFGRTNSQPYTSAQNGCGAMECITTGLKIRARLDGKVKIGDSFTMPQATLSMKDAFESLNAIHNIGMSVEPDTERGGTAEWLRVEPVRYFYTDDVIAEFENISEVKVALDADKVYNAVNVGYKKWETESVNGLNDVFTKRGYRTAIKAHSNDYNRVCDFIASDLAIEVTRRQYSTNSKDWRYDNDKFIICLTGKMYSYATFVVNTGNDSIIIPNNLWASLFTAGDTIIVAGSVSNFGTYTVTSVTFTVSLTIIKVAETLVNESSVLVSIENSTNPLYTAEQGNLTSSHNVLYPETFLNLRITPARNAIRHLPSVLQCYTNYAAGQLAYTSGEGNYLAQFDLADDACVLENGLLGENQNLRPDDWAEPETMYPFYRPELVTFEYPVTWAQYLAIKTDPRGLIGYQCGTGEMQYGWIEDFQLKPYTGMGQFTLRPKIEV